MENKGTNKYKVKVLKTSYERCVPERLDKLKTEYDLIIRSVKMPQKKTDNFGDYAVSFKDLSKEKRIVYFYGVPVKLSMTQFAILFMLLKERCIAEYSYKELVDKLNDKNDYKALTINFKSFISKFKKKFKDSIAQCEKLLVNKKKEEILAEIDSLLYYKLEMREYVMYTKFEIANPSSIE